MSAFDTSTNTPSVSFTNGYGTAVLQPSDANQYVYGFKRTQAKRYLEYYVNDAGGDISKLWVGLGYSPVAGDVWKVGAIFGSTGLYSLWQKPNVTQGSPPSTLGGLSSISTGDVYMFCVDFGGGTDHTGTQRAFTTTDGHSNKLLPVLLDVGKNGVWGNAQIGSSIYAAGGISGYQVPLVVRESTSASAATVSLRVVTTSFAYAIPSGFVAWGDGPEGGGSVTADAAVAWDPTKVSSGMSLSGGNYYAVQQTAVGTQFVMSTALPTTGKRVVEFHQPGTASWGIGLADHTSSITGTADTSTLKIGYPQSGRSFYKRSVNADTSITGSNGLSALGGYNFYGTEPGNQFFIDFNASRFWITGGLITKPLTFFGDLAASIADPYTGVDGITFTASVTMRLYGELRSGQTVGIYNFLNVGQEPFATYPLLPGWVSMNGNRQVYGVGATWDTSVAPASSSFESSNLTVRTHTPCVTQGTTTKSTGKYYFEIFNQNNLGDAGMKTAFGIRPTEAITISATAIDAAVDSGLYFDFVNTKKCRYGITTSWTVASLIPPSAGMVQGWVGVAVDFDQGYVWCGLWNKVTRSMGWLNSPAALINPDMTFTANTGMRIVCTNVSRELPVILVAEDNNVIGKPVGFDTWNGGGPETSVTATPSGTTGTGRVLWPYGVQT